MATPASNHLLGIILLLIVNVVWVASSELTKYLFVDLNFKRPLFTTYVKSTMFSLFMVRYLCTPNTSTPNVKEATVSYSKLENSVSEEDTTTEEYEVESLSAAEFEPVTQQSDIESELETARSASSVTITSHEESGSPSRHKRRRRVRFSLFREVRRLPDSLEAKLARRPYRPPVFDCECFKHPVVKYTLYFAPMWFASAVSYQAALAFSSVSSVNLITASSSLFVLMFSAMLSRRAVDRFSFTKLLLVLMNFGGVAVVSKFSPSLAGSALSLFSAITYALYLSTFSAYSSKNGRVDMNLMFGVIGLFAIFVCTPLMILVHESGLEPQLPPPTPTQLGVVVLNGLVGSIFADYLWLYATLLTNSLISSISLTLSIPLSMLADAVIRMQPPNAAQLLASVPIMLSFVGSTLVTTTGGDKLRKKVKNVHIDRNDEEGAHAESLNLIESEEQA